MGSSRRLATLVAIVSIALGLSGIAPQTVGAKSPPDQPRGGAAAAVGSGETHRFIDQEGTEVFAVRDGFDLDRYMYRSSNPLDFAIGVPSDVGPLDAAGHPAQGSPLRPQRASSRTTSSRCGPGSSVAWPSSSATTTRRRT